MRNRRFVVGLLGAGLMLVAGALPAQALLGVPTPPTPTIAGAKALVKSLTPQSPNIIVPSVPDPSQPAFPPVPYVAPPSGLSPALGVLSPTTVITCQAAYLGPIAGIVVLTAAMQAAGEHPLPPGFLNQAFSPATTLCVAAPFPTVKSCGPDGTITTTLAGLPAAPAVPGGLPTVDPFASVPAPFATLVVEIGAAQNALNYYLYDNTASFPLQHNLATKLECG